jgi:hypothetical protein
MTFDVAGFVEAQPRFTASAKKPETRFKKSLAVMEAQPLALT